MVTFKTFHSHSQILEPLCAAQGTSPQNVLTASQPLLREWCHFGFHPQRDIRILLANYELNFVQLGTKFFGTVEEIPNKFNIVHVNRARKPYFAVTGGCSLPLPFPPPAVLLKGNSCAGGFGRTAQKMQHCLGRGSGGESSIDLSSRRKLSQL